MSETAYIYTVVLSITFIAFSVKGATGFGTALVMIPVTSLVIGIRNAIVLSSVLDMVAGIILYFQGSLHRSRRFWMPLAGGMMAGTVIGAVILGMVPTDGFDKVLGGIILLLGGWYTMSGGSTDEDTLVKEIPGRCTRTDVAVATFAGFCGGLFGISGPPIVFHLGRYMAKKAFRGTLIAVFMYAGLARFTTYLATGLITLDVALIALAGMPVMLVGLTVGSRIFRHIPEVWFRRSVGVILVLTAVNILVR